MPKQKVLILILSALLVLSPLVSPVWTQAQTKEEMQRELAEIERQIAEQEKLYSGIKGQTQTQLNKLNQLRSQANSLNLQIQATSLRLNSLDTEIDVTEDNIEETSQKIEELRPRLASLIRELHDRESLPFVIKLFSHDSLSEAVDDVEYINSVSEDLAQVSEEMKNLRVSLADKQVSLEDQHESAKNLLAIQALQRNEYSAKVQEQNSVVSSAKAQESQAQASLAQIRAKAAQIRARLYDVAGGSSQNVTFGQAVQYAQEASSLTGVRAALLLAILTQESNLGKNVGTCNRAGDPPEKSWRVIMKPERDQPKYLVIVEELGLDPDTTPLSCPMRGKDGRQIGWGGAMGPAQFIPSTWMGYRDKVTALTGQPANPWNIRDAFIASAILLKANGATTDGENGEWKAAMRYFSGGTNLAFRFYGDNVLALARRYQADLDTLSQ